MRTAGQSGAGPQDAAARAPAPAREPAPGTHLSGPDPQDEVRLVNPGTPCREQPDLLVDAIRTTPLKKKTTAASHGRAGPWHRRRPTSARLPPTPASPCTDAAARRCAQTGSRCRQSCRGVPAAAASNDTRTDACQSTSSRMPVSSSVRLSKQDSFVAMTVDSTQGCMLLCRAFRIQPRFSYVAMT